MLKNLGFIIESLDDKPATDNLIINLNRLIDTTYIYHPIIFFDSQSRPKTLPKTCQLHHSQAWGFEGVIISNNLKTTQVLEQCNRATRKIFYIYDLEWTMLEHPIYSQLKHFYLNPEIELLARNEEDYKIITNVWKQPCGIVKDYQYDELIKIL